MPSAPESQLTLNFEPSLPEKYNSLRDFLAYRVQDLTTTVPRLARGVLGLPLLTWTVRTAEDRACAARFADQMIFEGFRP